VPLGSFLKGLASAHGSPLTGNPVTILETPCLGAPLRFAIDRFNKKGQDSSAKTHNGLISLEKTCSLRDAGFVSTPMRLLELAAVRGNGEGWSVWCFVASLVSFVTAAQPAPGAKFFFMLFHDLLAGQLQFSNSIRVSLF